MLYTGKNEKNNTSNKHNEREREGAMSWEVAAWSFQHGKYRAGLSSAKSICRVCGRFPNSFSKLQKVINIQNNLIESEYDR